MAKFTAEIAWHRNEANFTDRRYSRAHVWRFDGGLEVPASASPHVVPLPYSVAENVDPEEAYIAALSSCHMLFFLDFASRRNIVVDEYIDVACGIMAQRDGKTVITQVELRPKVTYSGDAPTAELEADIHHAAHDACFLANSVKTEISIKLS